LGPRTPCYRVTLRFTTGYPPNRFLRHGHNLSCGSDFDWPRRLAFFILPSNSSPFPSVDALVGLIPRWLGFFSSSLLDVRDCCLLHRYLDFPAHVTFPTAKLVFVNSRCIGMSSDFPLAEHPFTTSRAVLTPHRLSYS